MRTYAAALAEARTALAGAGIASAALDARLLMAAAAGLDTAALIARANENLPALAEGRFDAHLKRRIAGEPVARILGEKEFWGLPFEVNAATLVPRPDTETLVQAVLTEARSRFDGTFTICDLGTGSGAIVIALLSELPDARGVATDISEAALGDGQEKCGKARRCRANQLSCRRFRQRPGWAVRRGGFEPALYSERRHREPGCGGEGLRPPCGAGRRP